MKPILITTDFSMAASNAANYGADLALAVNADIILLHVYEMPVSFGEIPVTMTIENIHENAEREIIGLKDRLNQKTAGKINITTELRSGRFFPELKTICENIRPFAVVMGSQGTTAAEHLLFGNHTAHALKNLMWPLITVPPTVQFASIRKIGLACDLEKALDPIIIEELRDLVKAFDAGLHIFNIGKKGKFKPDLVFQSGVLEEMLKDLKPNFYFLAHQDTDEGILDFIEKNHIDLLIILPKRYSLLEKLIHKSHSKQMVLHSQVPVMAFHQ